MIQVSSLYKRYGDRTLFEDVSFVINPGEKLGLVGRNGDGKSTFFKLLTGAEEADEGDVIFPSGYRVGCLSQHFDFKMPTVKEEMVASLPQEEQWNSSYKADEILHGLGFSKEQVESDPTLLSGGFQIRLNLGKLILAHPDLLLLDEPTNYLDILSQRWLLGFLSSWKGEVVIVTHDHGFMNSVITHTLGIHRCKFKKVQGKTDKYFAQIALEEEVYEQSRVNQEKKIKKTEEFIKTFRAKASKAKAVQSKVKSLEKLDKLGKLEEIQNLDFKFSFTPFTGRRLCELRNLDFAYSGGETLICDLSVTIGPKDRIGIIGRNGKGKSTLLKLISGELVPCGGEIQSSPNAVTGYFGQTNIERLNSENTIEEEYLAMPSVDNRTRARTVAGLMMFQGDNALKKIQYLSGGEKSRVMLGKILLSPANMLLLDEPTNHLDMYSTDALLKAVKDFPGSVMMVTHSEMFLKEIATRLIVFDRGKVTLFEGGYQDFLKRVGWQEEADLPSESSKAKQGSQATGNSKKGKLIYTAKKTAARLERLIKKQEAEIQELTNKLIEITKDGYGKEAANLNSKIQSIKSETDKNYESLAEAYEILEEN